MPHSVRTIQKALPCVPPQTKIVLDSQTALTGPPDPLCLLGVTVDPIYMAPLHQVGDVAPLRDVPYRVPAVEVHDAPVVRRRQLLVVGSRVRRAAAGT